MSSGWFHGACLPDHAHRLAAEHGGIAGCVFASTHAVRVARRGEKAQVVDRKGVTRHRQLGKGLAGVLGLGAADRLAVLLE